MSHIPDIFRSFTSLVVYLEIGCLNIVFLFFSAEDCFLLISGLHILDQNTIQICSESPWPGAREPDEWTEANQFWNYPSKMAKRDNFEGKMRHRKSLLIILCVFLE